MYSGGHYNPYMAAISMNETEEARDLTGEQSNLSVSQPRPTLRPSSNDQNFLASNGEC